VRVADFADLALAGPLPKHAVGVGKVDLHRKSWILRERPRAANGSPRSRRHGPG
jgi:hypothetical protein